MTSCLSPVGLAIEARQGQRRASERTGPSARAPSAQIAAPGYWTTPRELSDTPDGYTERVIVLTFVSSTDFDSLCVCEQKPGAATSQLLPGSIEAERRHGKGVMT
jgi:hypothetical protein